MPRPDLDLHFNRINALIDEIDALVPAVAGYQAVRFRSDLAGLLVVAIAATYETCVKEVLSNYASSRHADFGSFAVRNYEKLNSRVRVPDLITYCEIFDPQIKVRFKSRLSNRKGRLLTRAKENIETSYEQVLTWRHDFAHAWNTKTTIEEAARTHRIGKRVL
jgi:hypothetical protein